MECGVYVITGKDGRVYVGAAEDIKARWWRLRRELRDGKHRAQALQNAWSRVGYDAEEYFTIEVVEPCLPSELHAKEREWILKLRSREPGIGMNTKPGRKPVTRDRDKIVYIKSGAALAHHERRQAWRKRLHYKRYIEKGGTHDAYCAVFGAPAIDTAK